MKSNEQVRKKRSQICVCEKREVRDLLHRRKRGGFAPSNGGTTQEKIRKPVPGSKPGLQVPGPAPLQDPGTNQNKHKQPRYQKITKLKKSASKAGGHFGTPKGTQVALSPPERAKERDLKVFRKGTIGANCGHRKPITQRHTNTITHTNHQTNTRGKRGGKRDRKKDGGKRIKRTKEREERGKEW